MPLEIARMKYIYDLISMQEGLFRNPIPITENWEWSFFDHVETTIHYKNSLFKTGPSTVKPFKNLFRPILNLQYRAEGFDVKDIIFFVEKEYKSFKSLLIRKYHNKWARENELDTFIDKIVESYVDFGGALVKKTAGKIPEVVPLQRLAFVDQSNMLGGPICEKHYFSPDELRIKAKEKGWKNIEEVIALAEKKREAGRRKVNTPEKYVEVYELHGFFPAYCLEEYEIQDKDEEDSKLVGQIHICTYYKKDNGETEGITLFKGLEPESPYDAVLRDEIYGRALGLGGGEELFQDQIWTNYGMIRLKELLDAASKVLLQTDDPTFANRNRLDNAQNLEIAVVGDGKSIRQIDTTPRTTGLFDSFVAQFRSHAQEIGAAPEAIFGNSPPAGTPFKSLELQVAEAHSLHEYRKGKLATFLDRIYRKWIIPQIVKDINQGTEFLAEFDADELELLATGVARCEVNKALRESIVKNEVWSPGLVNQFQEEVKRKFMEEGGRRFLKALRKEMADSPISVEVNIAGKQKDLAGKTDKLVNVLRFMLSTYNPQTGQFVVFQDPRMLKLFKQIIESSGLDPLGFDSYAPSQPAQPQVPPSVTATKPLQELAQRPSQIEMVSNR